MLLFFNPLCFLICGLKLCLLSGNIAVGKVFLLLGNEVGSILVMVGREDDAGIVLDMLVPIFSVDFLFLLSGVASGG